MTTDTTLGVGIEIDPAALTKVFDELEDRSKSFGSALTDALTDAIVEGEDLETVLLSLAERLSDIALDAGMKPLEGVLSSGISSLASKAGSLFAFADGGVPGRVVPFAEGGVVSAPTFFPMGGNAGLMGEAGAEAILPLRRGPDGTLGVASGKEGPATHVTVNIQAQDVQSFRKSEGQIAAMLARTVGRGRRGL